MKEVPLTWDGVVVGTAELQDDGTVKGWIAFDTPDGEKALAALNKGTLNHVSVEFNEETAKEAGLW